MRMQSTKGTWPRSLRKKRTGKQKAKRGVRETSNETDILYKLLSHKVECQSVVGYLILVLNAGQVAVYSP